MDMKSFVLGMQAGKNAGGGGTGGGSLPAGVYLEHRGVVPPNYYALPIPFTYKGEDYCSFGYDSSGTVKRKLYKLVDGAWSLVLDNAAFNASNDIRYLCEHNGKIHIFGYENTAHFVFDGTTCTQMNPPPAKFSDDALAASVNGVLYAYCKGNGTLYIWDEATDTWTSVVQLSTNTYTYVRVYNLNNELRLLMSGKLYKLTNGELEEVGTLDTSTWYAYEGCLYKLSGIKLFKYNPETDTSVVLGVTCAKAIRPYFCGEPRLSAGIYNCYQDFKLHIIEDTAEA